MFTPENEVYLLDSAPSAHNRLHVSGAVHKGMVPVSAAGGGFVFHVPESKLALFPKDYIEPLKAMEFEIEDTPMTAKGWSDGRSWNGWSCPLVEEKEMLRVVEVMLEWCKNDGHPNARIVRTEKDCDVLDGDQHLEGASLTKRVSPEGKPLWDLGGSYCWSDVVPVEPNICND